MRTERLYLTNWEYNRARIIKALGNIVKANDGRIKPFPYYNCLISNRKLTSYIQELRKKIAVCEKEEEAKPYPARAEFIKELKKKLEKMEAIPNEPIMVDTLSHIGFVLNDTYYYYSIADNFLFPFYYLKTPVKNGKYSADAGMEEASRTWLYDCFFTCECSQADCVEAAQIIFNELMNADNCKIIRDGKRTRVANTYNDGYHYEMVYKPERFNKIDF